MRSRNFHHSRLLVAVVLLLCSRMHAQNSRPLLHYTISASKDSAHYFHVELVCDGWNKDTIDLKMARWMPGYYQLMHYGKYVTNFKASDNKGKNIAHKNINDHHRQIITPKNKPFSVSYDVKADKKFVANSFIDSSYAYIIPGAAFFYIDGHMNAAVTVKWVSSKPWTSVTGLAPIAGKKDEYYAANVDLLFDCPILIGNLEELPSFKVKGITHRFIGQKPGSFDRVLFMNKLQKIVEMASGIIGDIPYEEYTFIGIGPGRGGIEHLNNTTVSFDGTGMDNPAVANRMMNFLAHEYFHHYNIKRIRPFELGPFDYQNENRTNLLWVSEGLSVYYEYLIVKRAGLKTEPELLADFSGNLNSHENNPGKSFQSLTQASYSTWRDGPFGKQGPDADKSISYYEKGPLVGLILDIAIRRATINKKSLDDVMRYLYYRYYKELKRGFTDAEFQEACEMSAGISLHEVFEYVYTAKEIDFNKYLDYLGLKVETTSVNNKQSWTIKRVENPSASQLQSLQRWLEK